MHGDRFFVIPGFFWGEGWGEGDTDRFANIYRFLPSVEEEGPNPKNQWSVTTDFLREAGHLQLNIQTAGQCNRNGARETTRGKMYARSGKQCSTP